MLNLKIESPFTIDAFSDMLEEIFKQKNFYEYDVTSHTRLQDLKRYVLDFYDERENVIFSGMIDVWKENEKTYVEFTEL